ncbi:hypothetical protein IHE44_0014679 [Lamprotornis superbus]|uniref:Uncharacterized protein n=1 Tax=Lamprotornis superbus TaxID=245042 RepID=A0A835NHR7_9PASS|nr:hypothetical protein IHE44_0014679 [Lamprotornis superbus]
MQARSKRGKAVFWGGDPVPEEQTQPFLAAGGWSRPVLSLLWVTGLPWYPSGASTQKLQLGNETPALLTRGMLALLFGVFYVNVLWEELCDVLLC